jgi:hypothetical protein
MYVMMIYVEAYETEDIVIDNLRKLDDGNEVWNKIL